MSEFTVTTGAVFDAGARLATISPGIDGIHGSLGACSGAAAGTGADAALEGLLSRWGATLPQFSAAGTRIAGAVIGAGTNYQSSDDGVAAAAQGGEPS